MLPSFVTHLPDGREKGTFIALDLGGTNFRVLLIDMQPNNPMLMDSQIYRIPTECMVGTGEQLFDHIAEKMADFIRRMGLNKRKVECGLGFRTQKIIYESYHRPLSSMEKYSKNFILT